MLPQGKSLLRSALSSSQPTQQGRWNGKFSIFFDILLSSSSLAFIHTKYSLKLTQHLWFWFILGKRESPGGVSNLKLIFYYMYILVLDVNCRCVGARCASACAWRRRAWTCEWRQRGGEEGFAFVIHCVVCPSMFRVCVRTALLSPLWRVYHSFDSFLLSLSLFLLCRGRILSF